MFSRAGKAYLKLWAIGLVILMSTAVFAQERSIEGEVLDGSGGVGGVTVTVIVDGKPYNSRGTKPDGKYSVRFPDVDRITKIRYEPTGSAYFPTEIEGASGKRDHRISVYLRKTTVALSASEALIFYHQAIETVKFDAAIGIATPERTRKYADIIDRIKIKRESMNSAVDYYSLQMKQAEARQTFGLEPGVIRDEMGIAVRPPSGKPWPLG